MGCNTKQASVAIGGWQKQDPKTCHLKLKTKGDIMSQYIIYSSHDPSPKECFRVLDAFVAAGAHYLTNAFWGCLDGEHTAWIVVEADNEHQARLMAPPVIRRTAQVVAVNKFTPTQIRELHRAHDAVEAG
jgi:hypothetical protein